MLAFFFMCLFAFPQQLVLEPTFKHSALDTEGEFIFRVHIVYYVCLFLGFFYFLLMAMMAKLLLE